MSRRIPRALIDVELPTLKVLVSFRPKVGIGRVQGLLTHYLRSLIVSYLIHPFDVSYRISQEFDMY